MKTSVINHIMSIVRKCISQRLFVVTMLLSSLLGIRAIPNEPTPCDSASMVMMEQTWREFRAVHPFGFQTVGLKHYGDTCVFVMSEPGEWVKKEVLDSLFAQYGGHVITAKKKFGFDGALYDAVGCAKLNAKNFKSLEKKLFTLLYGTDEKPYYTNLDQPSRHAYFTKNRLDTIKPQRLLEESIYQNFFEYPVRRYSSFFSPHRNFDFFPGLTSLITLYPCLRNSMYYSEMRGVVLWGINPSDRVFSDSLFHKNARRFVLDCDLILAACCYGSKIFLIGREREIPVNVLPPLRTETIRLLASLDEGDFSVSIGSCLNSEDDFDGYVEDSVWARPVMMSDKLRNTELGNLLMLTDVLLLSWGNHAEVRELFIDYPKPAHPLFDLGFSYLNEEPNAYYWKLPDGIADEGGIRFKLFDRLGCLPPLFTIPQRHPNSNDSIVFEARAYDVFSSLNNTDLIRAAQYALIYKAFQTWRHRTGNRVALTETNADNSWVQTPSMTILNVPWGMADYLE